MWIVQPRSCSAAISDPPQLHVSSTTEDYHPSYPFAWPLPPLLQIALPAASYSNVLVGEQSLSFCFESGKPYPFLALKMCCNQSHSWTAQCHLRSLEIDWHLCIHWKRHFPDSIAASTCNAIACFWWILQAFSSMSCLRIPRLDPFKTVVCSLSYQLVCSKWPSMRLSHCYWQHWWKYSYDWLLESWAQRLHRFRCWSRFVAASQFPSCQGFFTCWASRSGVWLCSHFESSFGWQNNWKTCQSETMKSP